MKQNLPKPVEVQISSIDDIDYDMTNIFSLLYIMLSCYHKLYYFMLTPSESGLFLFYILFN